MAYFYRGHHLYGELGNTIVPIPFATKEIHVVGTVSGEAPPYHRKDPRLVEEKTIAALFKSMTHEWENLCTQEASPDDFYTQQMEVTGLMPETRRSGLPGM